MQTNNLHWRVTQSISIFWETLHHGQFWKFTTILKWHILMMTLPQGPILNDFVFTVNVKAWWCDTYPKRMCCSLMPMRSLELLHWCKNHDYRQQCQNCKTYNYGHRLALTKHKLNVPWLALEKHFSRHISWHKIWEIHSIRQHEEEVYAVGFLLCKLYQIKCPFIIRL